MPYVLDGLERSIWVSQSAWGIVVISVVASRLGFFNREDTSLNNWLTYFVEQSSLAVLLKQIRDVS